MHAAVSSSAAAAQALVARIGRRDDRAHSSSERDGGWVPDHAVWLVRFAARVAVLTVLSTGVVAEVVAVEVVAVEVVAVEVVAARGWVWGAGGVRGGGWGARVVVSGGVGARPLAGVSSSRSSTSGTVVCGTGRRAWATIVGLRYPVEGCGRGIPRVGGTPSGVGSIGTAVTLTPSIVK